MIYMVYKPLQFLTFFCFGVNLYVLVRRLGGVCFQPKGDQYMSATMVANSTRPVHLKPIFGKRDDLLTVTLEGTAHMSDELIDALVSSAAGIDGVKYTNTAGDLLIVAYEGHTKDTIIDALKKAFKGTGVAINGGGRRGRVARLMK